LRTREAVKGASGQSINAEKEEAMRGTWQLRIARLARDFGLRTQFALVKIIETIAR
jgi:hypothetical protein